MPSVRHTLVITIYLYTLWFCCSCTTTTWDWINLDQIALASVMPHTNRTGRCARQWQSAFLMENYSLVSHRKCTTPISINKCESFFSINFCVVICIRFKHFRFELNVRRCDIYAVWTVEVDDEGFCAFLPNGPSGVRMQLKWCLAARQWKMNVFKWFCRFACSTAIRMRVQHGLVQANETIFRTVFVIFIGRILCCHWTQANSF